MAYATTPSLRRGRKAAERGLNSMIDSAPERLRAGVLEGKYEHYSIRVNDRLATLRKELKESIAILESNGLVSKGKDVLDREFIWKARDISALVPDPASRHSLMVRISEIYKSDTGDPRSLTRAIANAINEEVANPVMRITITGRFSKLVDETCSKANKTEALKWILGLVDGIGEFRTCDEIGLLLKKAGSEYAGNLLASGEKGTFDRTGDSLVRMATTLLSDPSNLENAKRLDSLSEKIVKYERSTHPKHDRGIFSTSQSNSILRAKVLDSLYSIDTAALAAEAKNLLYAKEALRMNRLVRLRLSFSLGEKHAEAAEIASTYFKKYYQERRKLGEEEYMRLQYHGMQEQAERLVGRWGLDSDGKTARPEGSRSASEILLGEAMKLEQMLREAEEHLKFSRKLGKGSTMAINAASTRLYSLYNTSSEKLRGDALFPELMEKLGITEKGEPSPESIPSMLGRLIGTANSYGNKLSFISIDVKNEKIRRLSDVFSNSESDTEMILMLMNANNQKDIYRYFGFLEKRSVHIGEFMLAALELKKATMYETTPMDDPGEVATPYNVVDMSAYVNARRRAEGSSSGSLPAAAAPIPNINEGE